MEINHAIFFLKEMDRKKFKIPRLLMQELFRQKYALVIFKKILNMEK
jgi:hypothetical protein